MKNNIGNFKAKIHDRRYRESLYKTTRKGGDTPFNVDITGNLKEENRIVVVDNTREKDDVILTISERLCRIYVQLLLQ